MTEFKVLKDQARAISTEIMENFNLLPERDMDERFKCWVSRCKVLTPIAYKKHEKLNMDLRRLDKVIESKSKVYETAGRYYTDEIDRNNNTALMFAFDGYRGLRNRLDNKDEEYRQIISKPFTELFKLTKYGQSV